MLFHLHKVQPNKYFKNKRSVKKLKDVPNVFHIHEIEKNIFHIVIQFKEADVSKDINYLNSIYFLKEKCIYIEQDKILTPLFEKHNIYTEFYPEILGHITINIPCISHMIKELKQYIL